MPNAKCNVFIERLCKTQFVLHNQFWKERPCIFKDIIETTNVRIETQKQNVFYWLIVPNAMPLLTDCAKHNWSYKIKFEMKDPIYSRILLRQPIFTIEKKFLYWLIVPNAMSLLTDCAKHNSSYTSNFERKDPIFSKILLRQPIYQ